MNNRITQLLVVFSLLATIASCADPELEEEEIRALDFMRYMDSELTKIKKSSLLATFNYDTNMTKTNRKMMNGVYAENIKKLQDLSKELHSFNWYVYKSKDLKRQFKLLSVLGVDALPELKHKKYLKGIHDIQDVQLSSKICDFENKTCDLTLSPDVIQIFKTSQNSDQLQYTYTEYLSSIATKIKTLYKEYVDIRNEAASLNGFENPLDEEIFFYEEPNLRAIVSVLYSEIRPLYTMLHGYVRHKLREKYGEFVSKNGPIPIHLTGGLVGNSFANLYNLTKPFPDVENDFAYDIELNYTTIQLFKLVEDFYTSTNLSDLPDTFWSNSVFKRARETHCVGRVYDIPNDPRVKFCNEGNLKSFQEAYEMIGQIEYFMSSGYLPEVYKRPSNGAFLRAVGLTGSLAAISVDNLKTLNIIKDEITDNFYINHAYYILLNILPRMTYSYAMTKWEVKVFNETNFPADWNCKWWKVIEEFHGLEPPTDRSSADFDVAAGIADGSYNEEFLARILQFQFFKALCKKVNETQAQELNKCNYYGFSNAGNSLREMMRLGSGVAWPELLKILTGHKRMDSAPLLNYFKPLQLWLEKEIERLNIPVGWIKSTRACR